MMNWKRISILASAAMLAGVLCVTAASAAVVDKTAPYEGEYFIAYNATIGYTSVAKSTSGSLPSTAKIASYLLAGRDAISDDADDSVSSDIVDIRIDEDGRTLYRTEPRNLDKIKPPVQTFTFYDIRSNSVPQLGDERSFVTVNLYTDTSQKTPFILKYSGDNCNIWLEKDDARGITDEMVSELGMEYDYHIHERMQKAFGPAYDLNGDGKMAILLYDVQDQYSLDPDCGAYTGGFFNNGDMLTDSYNCMDVLHIDTYPSIPKSGNLDEVKGTIVHELQHLTECSAMIVPSPGNSGTPTIKFGELPVWVNEGLSMAAEHMFCGVLNSRIDYYNNTKYYNNTPLANWDYGDALSHYALSYLFVQYLRTQTKDFLGGGEELYRQIINSENRGDRCVEAAMRSFYPNISFADILLNFNIALILNEDSGPHGFSGDKDFDAIQGRISSGKSTYLGCGAAIVTHPGRGKYNAPSDASNNISFAAFRLADEDEVLPVDMPTADEASGETYKFRNIKLSCLEPFATIYYTVDGTVPTPETGIVYTGKPITLLSTTELKAITVAADGRQSEVATYKYTIGKENFELYRRTVGSNTVYNGVDCAGVVVAPDGGYIQVGSIRNREIGTGDFYEMDIQSDRSTNNNIWDIYSGYIMKYTVTGEQKWVKPLRSSSDVKIFSATAADDGFVVAGEARWGNQTDRGNPSTYDFANALTPKEESPEELENARSRSAYLAKYDWEGNLQWLSALPFIRANSNSYYTDMLFNDVAPLRDESGDIYGYVAVGSMYDPEASGSNSESTMGLIARFDVNGNLVWKNFLKGRMNSKGGYFRTVALSHDGKHVVAGGQFGSVSFGKEDGRDWANTTGKKSIQGFYPIAASFDVEDGSLQWNMAYNFDFVWSMANGWITDILPLEDGSFIAVGFDNQYGTSTVYKIHIMRIDAEGAEVWRTVESLATGFTPAVSLAEDGIMVMHTVGVQSNGKTWLNAHKLSPISREHMDFLALKYNMDGKLLWTKNYLAPYQESAQGFNGYQVNNLIRLSERKYLVCASRNMTSYYDNYLQSHGILFTFYDEHVPHYDVTGTITTAEGAPVVGVSVKYTLADDPTEYAILTDSQGQYSVKVIKDGSVTLTPELEGYTFASVVTSAESETVGPMTAASANHDFTAEFVKYTVSGKVTGPDGEGLPGIQVGPEPEDVTGEDGAYSYPDPNRCHPVSDTNHRGAGYGI